MEHHLELAQAREDELLSQRAGRESSVTDIVPIDQHGTCPTTIPV